MENDIFLSEKVNSNFSPGQNLGSFSGASDGSLGKNSKSAALFELFNDTTGEYHSVYRGKNGEYLISENPENFFSKIRVENFKVRIKSRSTMFGTRTKKGKIPAVCYCGLARRKVYETGPDGITRSTLVNAHIRYKEDNNRAYYGGLMACASVWLCPVCRSKVLYHRASEVQEAVNYALSMGSDCLMLTYTFRHKKHEPLKQNIDNFTHCIRNFKASKSYKTVLTDMGFFGAIRGLEITWSEKNGFHPHTHELLFFDRDLLEIDLQPFLSSIRKLWAKYCKKYGLGAPAWGIGVKLSYKAGKDKVGAYLSKWSLSQELSGPSKEARPGSLTPFDFLRKTESPDDLWALLFREYASALYGRAQLYWSRGLKNRLLIEEISDQQIADQDPSESVPVFVFENYTWKQITNNHQEKFAAILEAYESGGYQGLMDFFSYHKITI